MYVARTNIVIVQTQVLVVISESNLGYTCNSISMWNENKKLDRPLDNGMTKRKRLQWRPLRINA